MEQAKSLGSGKAASAYKTAIVYVLILLIPVLLGVWARGATLTLVDMPVDYGNYIRGMQLLYQGENPYGRLEFFEPPWIAFILSAFYLLRFPLFWQVACILFVSVLILVTYRQFSLTPNQYMLIAGLVSSFMLPTTILALMLGQLSSLVGVVVVWLYARLANGRIHILESVFGLVLITLKPHVVLLPVLIFCLELAKRRKWWTLILTATTVLLLAFLSAQFLLHDWLSALVQSLTVDRKFLGGEGLAAPNFYNYSDLGISPLFFVPLFIYAVVLWIRKGINQYLLLLLLTLNFMLVPYSRQYDYVLLLPPWLYIFSKWTESRQYPSILILFLLMAIVPFFSKAYVLVPTILFALLLLMPPRDVTRQAGIS